MGTPPQLTCCTEYSHEGNGNCAADAYIFGVAFSPDGKFLATGADNGTVKLWSFDGKALTATSTVLTAPGVSLYGYVAFSPDGKYLAVGADGEVDVYNVGTWTAVTPTLTITDATWGVGFAADSKHVITMDDATVYVHTVGVAAPLATRAINLDGVEALAVSSVVGAGGQAIVVAGDAVANGTGRAAAEVFQLSSQGTLTSGVTLSISSGVSGDNELYSAAVAPDGTSLALGDYDAQVWFAGIPSANATIPATTPSITIDANNYQIVYGVAYSPNNARYLAVAGGLTQSNRPGTVTIWDVGAKSTYASYSGVRSQPLSVTFSPSGNAIVVGEGGCGRVLLCTNWTARSGPAGRGQRQRLVAERAGAFLLHQADTLGVPGDERRMMSLRAAQTQAGERSGRDRHLVGHGFDLPFRVGPLALGVPLRVGGRVDERLRPFRADGQPIRPLVDDRDRWVVRRLLEHVARAIVDLLLLERHARRLADSPSSRSFHRGALPELDIRPRLRSTLRSRPHRR